MIERTWGSDDEPNMIVAMATELLTTIEGFRGHAIWEQIVTHAERRIAGALTDFERGNGNDHELRGRIAAYRELLSLPDRWAAEVQRDIDNNRGKILE